MVKDNKQPKKPKITKEERKLMYNDLTIEGKKFNIDEFEKQRFGNVQQINTQDEIEEAFNEVNGNDNPAKELFSNKGDVRLKTELSKKQISAITRLNYLSVELNFPELKQVTDDFMHLMISHDRKSRKEFVETMKLNNDNSQGGGFFNRFRGIFNNGN